MSAIGSGFMAVSFYLCEGYAFFVFNLTWMAVSVLGYRKRQVAYLWRGVCVSAFWVDLILIPLMLSAFIATVVGYLELSSWLAVSLLISAYFLFASKRISRSVYVFSSMVAFICSLRYLGELGNYPSLAHTFISIALSIWALLYSKKRFDEGSG